MTLMPLKRLEKMFMSLFQKRTTKVRPSVQAEEQLWTEEKKSRKLRQT